MPQRGVFGRVCVFYPYCAFLEEPILNPEVLRTTLQMGVNLTSISPYDEGDKA